MSLRYPNEHVLVVPRSLFDALGEFQGLSFEVDRHLPAFLDPANNYFLQRDEAEHDPTRKQIIPYAIFHHAGRFLRYVRSKKSGEQRLAAKASLGVGGHINAGDAAAASLERSTYLAGVEREIAEELRIEGGWTQRIVALLNDDSSEVGQVHFGVVHLVDLENDRVTPNEETITEIEFLTPAELRVGRECLETWSQMCLDGLEHFR
jgi:predicted NUDIX family phosphoesterase